MVLAVQAMEWSGAVRRTESWLEKALHVARTAAWGPRSSLYCTAITKDLSVTGLDPTQQKWSRAQRIWRSPEGLAHGQDICLGALEFRV